MVKQELAECLRQAVLKAQQKGVLGPAALPEVLIEHPQSPEHGDFATSLPMKLARAMKTPPMVIAEGIRDHILPPAQIGSVAVAPPGFINFTLRDDWLSRQVQSILDAGESYGEIDLGKGKRVQVEFVSVNPTGPLHVGHGRGAVLGSTLANVLSISGFSTEREYYVNDMGSQIDNFGHSLYARYLQCLGREAAVPEGGYHGKYMVELAEEIVAEEGDRFLHTPEQEAVAQLAEIGTSRMLEGIKRDFKLLRVEFDVWFSEKTLYADGK
ncbi:MAG: arginine--tRNA ligase, partial [Dehalococcoidia bacterium]